MTQLGGLFFPTTLTSYNNKAAVSLCWPSKSHLNVAPAYLAATARQRRRSKTSIITIIITRLLDADIIPP